MNEKQQQAIILFASGKTCKVIAEQLNVTPKTISTWRACPEFMAMLNSYLQDIQQANSERLRNLGTTALDTIEEIMSDKTIAPKDRLNAAVKILELGRVTTEPVQSSDPAKLRVKAMFDDLALLP
ncbi:MAG: helix-turn-helix domain-containing protein [Nitrosomonas sp.]|nr:helix-turn-helix domain-containing protein [Nitrosomonas sp.]